MTGSHLVNLLLVHGLHFGHALLHLLHLLLLLCIVLLVLWKFTRGLFPAFWDLLRITLFSLCAWSTVCIILLVILRKERLLRLLIGMMIWVHRVLLVASLSIELRWVESHILRIVHLLLHLHLSRPGLRIILFRLLVFNDELKHLELVVLHATHVLHLLLVQSLSLLQHAAMIVLVGNGLGDLDNTGLWSCDRLRLDTLS